MARQIRPGQLQENVLYNISASFAVSASHEITHEVSSSYAETASFAVTASHLLNNPPAFPYTGSAEITGSLNVIGEFTASGLNYPILDGDEKQIISTDSEGRLSFDWADRTNIDVKNTSGATLTIGTPIYITGYQGASIFQIAAASASDSNKMPAVGVLSQTLNPNDQGYATLLGALRGYDTQTYSVNDSLYVGEGILTSSRPTGSSLIQKIARVGNIASNGEITILGAGRTNDIPNITSGYIWVGNNDSIATAVATSSIQNVISSSYALQALTASYAVTASHLLNTPPAFPFTGDAQITGSLLISGSKIHLRGQSASPGPILELESINGGSGKDVYVKVGDSNENYAYVFGADDTGNTFRISGGSYSSATLGTNDKFIIDGNDIEFPSGNISGSATSTASFGTYLGDGSQLTGISTTPFPFVGDAVITGSLVVSGSGTQGGLRTNTRNIILGQGAGNNQNATNGPYNVMIGYQAGYTNTTGDSNVCIGQNAGYALSTNASDDNIFIGKLAGAGGTSPAARMSDANYNIALGYETMLYLTSGDSNIGFGFRTMRNISSGKYNLAYGDGALYNTDTGQNNIGIGRSAGAEQTAGTGNITIGSGSLGVAGESNQLRIGNGNTITTISASLETGDIIFASTASAEYLSTPAGNLSPISASYALTASHALNAGGTTPTLQEVTDQGASTSNDITISGDLTASADISLPTNASSIKFNSAELHGRVGGSYPGLTINSGVSSGDRIWLRDAQGATGPVTMSFIGLGKIDGVQSIEGQGNRPLILRGGAGPNDANDGIQMFTGDASNVYQQRFQIEADGTNVDAYFHNINGLGINDTTPTAMLDVNGNINAATDITASGDIHAIGNISASTFIGDGTNVTGVVSASYAITASHALNSSGGGTPTFIASGSTSASAAPNTGVVVEHSGSTAFSVIGDVGTLFSVDDDLTGTLFSANDISGFPVLQADATGEVYLGKSPQSLYTTAVISSNTANITQSIYGISTSSYAGAFIEYTAFSGSHDARAGSLMAIWSGSAVNFTETTTTDFGNTSNLLMQVAISQSQAQVQSYSTTAGYKIKTIIKAI